MNRTKLPFNPFTRSEKFLSRELECKQIRREFGMDKRVAPSKRAAKGGGKGVGRTDNKQGAKLMDMKFRALRKNAEFIY